MSDQLTASVSLVNEKVKFKGVSRSNPEVILDYTPPVGDGEGYTALELFLVSLATCSGTSIALLLRKMRKDVAGLRVDIKGNRREQHPTYFEKIHMEFSLTSKDVEDSDMEKVLKLSEESICPVWNMVKNNVEISCGYKISRG
ncbi:MAG TPA: OsmC family protein [Candidatus Nitrosocosmicus sp.]|nr:OsmC family protein [Candidatus Nitrosocosmicus sp.]